MEDLWPPILYRARGGGESDFDRGPSRIFSGLYVHTASPIKRPTLLLYVERQQNDRIRRWVRLLPVLRRMMNIEEAWRFYQTTMSITDLRQQNEHRSTLSSAAATSGGVYVDGSRIVVDGHPPPTPPRRPRTILAGRFAADDDACIVLYCTVLYCTVLYCTVLYLYCSARYIDDNAVGQRRGHLGRGLCGRLSHTPHQVRPGEEDKVLPPPLS
jgi:hypothetical protein